VPHFKEKKRQGRKLFLRQAGEREPLLSCCIHQSFPKVTLSLPLSAVFHRPSVVQITQPLLGSPPVSEKNDYIFFSFCRHFLSFFSSLPLFFHSSQDSQNSCIVKGGSNPRNSRIQSHQKFINISKFFLCCSALIVNCSCGILQPRFMRTVAHKATVSLICY